jgi:hypothetical protein
VLAVLGAELARAVALGAFAERVQDFAVPGGRQGMRKDRYGIDDIRPS